MEINIKNRPYHILNDITNIKKFDPSFFSFSQMTYTEILLLVVTDTIRLCSASGNLVLKQLFFL